MKLLIANRGEIAVRIIHACRELGVRAVAVYSEADAGALHVRLADEAVAIGPAAPGESYLRIDRIVAAAREAGAEAVHPGYGFLSENAAFAEAVRGAGLIFVGPPAEAMRQMGGKIEARRLMRAAGVPVVPGYEGEGGWEAAAEQMGYPVLVKAAGGGGGRGMRVVAGRGDLAAALEGARREAEGAFGDGRVFIEKYVARGRHIEFQVLGDAHGNVVHLFERECSVQRRHQKLVEEAPSPLLCQHPALRERMGAAAVRAARAVGYQNAGTVEFIVDPDTREFYFLEMNTRLQVEHPVTEAVTGLDLVHLQLRVAAGEALPFSQADLIQRGHALECRVYAEDPTRGFLPSVGPLLKVVEPRGPGVRVDSGCESGDAVSQHYDALLAKVITHGATRGEALQRMRAALAGYHVLGIVTNTTFLRALLAHPAFEAGEATTRFVDEHFGEWQPAQALPVEALAAAALAEHLGRGAANGRAVGAGASYDPWGEGDGFRMGASPSPLSPLAQGEGKDQPTSVAEMPAGQGFAVTVKGETLLVRAALRAPGELALEWVDGRRARAFVAGDGERRWVALDPAPEGGPVALEMPRRDVGRGRRGGAAGHDTLEAQMPGVVRRVLAAPGDRVERGQALVLLEAMKMEIRVTAPHAGVVERVGVEEGAAVERGQVLVELAATDVAADVVTDVADGGMK